MIVRLSKSWNDLAAIANHLPSMVREQRSLFAKEIAKLYYDGLMAHLENQDLPWPPLTPGYLEFKRRTGLDLRTWIATGVLKNSIKTFAVEDDERQTVYYVGVDPSITYEDGTPVALVAWVMEYGRLDKSMPARPLFRPTFKETRDQLRALAKRLNPEVYEMYIKRYLGR